MPRTSKIESPGCPPLRVLTTDVLGLVKVIEARRKSGIPKVVETWGSPDASQGVVVGSLSDDITDPLLAIARKNGTVELLNPLNGDVLNSFLVHEVCMEGQITKGDSIVGLHLFNRKGSGSFSRLSMLLMCTENGKACLRSFRLRDTPEASMSADSPNLWDVCSAGKILCSSLDESKKYALFAGKGVEVNVCDLDKCQKIWTAKSPSRDSVGIFTPTWFTAATFLCKEDSRKLVAGTNNHQVRLYDVAAQRRPVISVDFRESSITAVTEDVDGYCVYVGTGSGDLASFDMRTGKLLGCFVGKCCGSIRSIARHPKLPVIASCGLDSYLRFWDARTRQLLSAVFLKQHLTNVVIDSNFSDEEVTTDPADEQFDFQINNPEEAQDGDEPPFSRRKKILKKERGKRAKTKVCDAGNQSRANKKVIDPDAEENKEMSVFKAEDASEMTEHNKRIKSKKRKTTIHGDNWDSYQLTKFQQKHLGACNSMAATRSHHKVEA